MKFTRKIKAFLFSLLILPCVLVFSACDTNSAVVAVNTYILSIEKTSTEGLTDTYTITYSNGTTSTFTITNGKDGENGKDGADAQQITLSQAYDSAIEHGFTGTYLDFLKEYLKTDAANREVAATNLGLLSAVSVSVSYNYESTYQYIDYGTGQIKSITQTKTATQAGSGVIYKFDKAAGNAYIITNYHVVYGASKGQVIENVKINIYGHQTTDEAIDAVYVGGSMTYDIAVLKVTNSELLKNSNCVAVEDRFGNSDETLVGTTAIAIGNAAGFGISATSGIVSVDSEYISMYSVDNTQVITFRTMRIDTTINGGNSGGAVYDDNGKVIGIVNARITKTDIENIAYTIPANIAKNVADSVLYYETVNPASKKISKFNFGISTTAGTTSSILSDDLKVSTIEQVTVSSIIETSFSKTQLNLQVGDVITKIKVDETEYAITRTFQISDLSLAIRPNSSITVYFTRNNETLTATATASSTFFDIVS